MAIKEIMDILEKYDINNSLVLLSDHTFYEGHIGGDTEVLAKILQKGADLQNVTAIECRKFINNVYRIKL